MENHREARFGYPPPPPGRCLREWVALFKSVWVCVEHHKRLRKITTNFGEAALAGERKKSKINGRQFFQLPFQKKKNSFSFALYASRTKSIIEIHLCYIVPGYVNVYYLYGNWLNRRRPAMG